MKKILLIVLSGFWFVASYGQTAGVPSNITSNQALRAASSKQTGGTLPVLKLVPVTTSGKYTFSQGQYLTNDGLMGGFMRKLPDGTYGLAVDGSLIGAGGSSTPSNLALGTGTATSQPITNSNGTGVTLTGATTGTAGLLIGTDKAKLDLITVTSAVNLNNLLLGNTAITGATKTKITYDSKGLVTAGADATAADILNVASGTIAATNVQAAVNELNAEKQTNIQFQNATTNLGTSGTATTVNFTGGATATRAGDVVTVNVATTPLALYSDDVEAAAGGVAIGSSYYLDFDNPFGASIGMVKVRIN